MRLIGLRHGQSHYNLLGLCNDDPARRVDLTDQGVRQACAAAERLAGEPIERVFCSPLLRARRTAEIVVAGRDLQVTLDERLADIRSGFEGQPVTEYLAAIVHDPIDARANGGESLRVVEACCVPRGLVEVVGKAFDNGVPYVFQLRTQ